MRNRIQVEQRILRDELLRVAPPLGEEVSIGPGVSHGLVIGATDSVGGFWICWSERTSLPRATLMSIPPHVRRVYRVRFCL